MPVFTLTLKKEFLPAKIFLFLVDSHVYSIQNIGGSGNIAWLKL